MNSYITPRSTFLDRHTGFEELNILPLNHRFPLYSGNFPSVPYLLGFSCMLVGVVGEIVGQVRTPRPSAHDLLFLVKASRHSEVLLKGCSLFGGGKNGLTTLFFLMFFFIFRNSLMFFFSLFFTGGLHRSWDPGSHLCCSYPRCWPSWSIKPIPNQYQ